MLKKLKIRATMTVEALRADRSLNIKIIGEISADLSGDVSGLRGDVSGLWGDVSGLRGDVSGLWGDVSGLRGDISGLRGNVDDCGISDEEREAGIEVRDLLEE